MDLATIGALVAITWFITMWRLNGLTEEVRILRARVEKGAPLTQDEEGQAAEGLQGEPKKA